jgi:hypothetical protein
MSSIPRPLATTSALTLLLLTAACGSTASEEQQPEGTSGSAVDVPDFSGPYAAEFAETYRSADSEFVRLTLADEQISDAEYAEMTELFRQCLADVGITFNGFDETGAYSTSLAPNPDETRALVDGCGAETGQDSVGMLRDLLAVNPQNQDMATLIADCLVREGVVEPGYGPDDYAADNEGRFASRATLPEDLAAALETCSADPLGHG